ncbi:MAG: pilus assembly protein PilW, partial [Cardiobacteriaceae bacterium]|nr:pilus assembly protein PilW [Cardiobacteriaceae bacterium]
MTSKKTSGLRATFLAAALLAGACSTSPNSERSSRGPNYDKAYDDYIALGAQYLQMGRFDLAEPKLKRAIEINSQNPEAWNVLAVLYEEKRDIASGYQVYEKLVSSHPNYTLGFMNFATFLCKFDREPERQNLYGRMRAKGGEFTTLSYIAEGNCEREKGRMSGAEGAY